MSALKRFSKLDVKADDRCAACAPWRICAVSAQRLREHRRHQTIAATLQTLGAASPFYFFGRNRVHGAPDIAFFRTGATPWSRWPVRICERGRVLSRRADADITASHSFFTGFLPAQSECRPESVWCARPGKTFEAIVPLRTSRDERKVAVDWLKTGASGFEHVFDDAIPKFSFGLGLGLPGCTEVMLTHQIIVELASPQWPVPDITVPGEPSNSRCAISSSSILVAGIR